MKSLRAGYSWKDPYSALWTIEAQKTLVRREARVIEGYRRGNKKVQQDQGARTALAIPTLCGLRGCDHKA